MEDFFYSKAGRKHYSRLLDLKKDTFDSFMAFNQKAFEEGALSVKVKELIAVGAAHITRCPFCIETHVQKAQKAGASAEEIAEAVFIAMALNAGASFAHSTIAMEALEKK
jgi:AhpD family alkylhydroperoxidase